MTKENTYVSTEELELLKAFQENSKKATMLREIALAEREKAHANLRAVEAELRAIEAEYNSSVMKLIWKYKVEEGQTIRQSDGLIMRCKKNEKTEDKGNENDPSNENKENQRNV